MGSQQTGEGREILRSQTSEDLDQLLCQAAAFDSRQWRSRASHSLDPCLSALIRLAWGEVFMWTGPENRIVDVRVVQYFGAVDVKGRRIGGEKQIPGR